MVAILIPYLMGVIMIHWFRMDVWMPQNIVSF